MKWCMVSVEFAIFLVSFFFQIQTTSVNYSYNEKNSEFRRGGGVRTPDVPRLIPNFIIKPLQVLLIYKWKSAWLRIVYDYRYF